MPLSSDEIERIDREHKRASERDPINERSGQIWPLFLTMSTVFGILGLPNGEVANVVGLFPLLISCLAQHLHDSQLAVDADRKYLLKQEEEANCTTGGEYFFQELRKSRVEEKKSKTSFGENKRALRRAFVVTSLTASYFIVTHLQANHAHQWFIWAVACIELFVTGQTVYGLTYWKPIVHW